MRDEKKTKKRTVDNMRKRTPIDWLHSRLFPLGADVDPVAESGAACSEYLTARE